jgi:anti-anti-sigma factor
MPGQSENCHLSSAGLTITLLAVRGETRRARLSLAGEIDLGADGALRASVDWLTRLGPATVLIDLAYVTFAGSALPNFVVRASGALPHGAEMILQGAMPRIRQVLRITGMDDIATITV